MLYTFTQEEPYSFSHEAFVATSLFDSALCGDITYEATFDGSIITESSLPVAYDPVTRQFSVFSEDLNLVGLKDITVKGFFVDHVANEFTISF